MDHYLSKETEVFLESREYEMKFEDMTGKERCALHEWIADGNTPYDNPYLLYWEDGGLMDFITATRLDEAWRNNPKANLRGVQS